MRIILFFIFCFCAVLNMSVAQKPVRIGVAGLSLSQVLPFLRNLGSEDIQILVIAENDRELLGQFSIAFSPEKNILFESLDEMLLKKPEGATTITFIFDHLKVVKAFAHLGIQVMVEKPLAVSTKHNEALRPKLVGYLKEVYYPLA